MSTYHMRSIQMYLQGKSNYTLYHYAFHICVRYTFYALLSSCLPRNSRHVAACNEVAYNRSSEQPCLEHPSVRATTRIGLAARLYHHMPKQ